MSYFTYHSFDTFRDVYPYILPLKKYIIAGMHAFICYKELKNVETEEMNVVFYSQSIEEWKEQIENFERNVQSKWRKIEEIKNSSFTFEESKDDITSKRKIIFSYSNYTNPNLLLANLDLGISQIGFNLVGMGYKFSATKEFQKSIDSEKKEKTFLIYYDSHKTKNPIELSKKNKKIYQKIKEYEVIGYTAISEQVTKENLMFSLETKKEGRIKNSLNGNIF